MKPRIASVLLTSVLLVIGGATSSLARSAEQAEECAFEDARYVALEGEPKVDAATLSFALFKDGMTALSAVLVTPEGRKFNVSFSFSNGYVQTYASLPLGNERIESVVQAFSADMKRVWVGSGHPAATYILMPQAGFDAYDKQFQSGPVTFTIPDGAWKFDHCRK